MKNLVKFKKTSNLILLTIFCALFLPLPTNATHPSSGALRELSAFNKLDIGGAYKIILVQGSKNSLSFEGDAESIAKVISKVEGSTLKIYHNKKMGKAGDVTITVNFTELQEIDCSGAITLTSAAPLTFKNLELDFSGTCKTELEISAEKLEVDISGTGNANLKGKANKVEVDISGTGKFNAEDLVVSEYEIEISGVGNAIVQVSTILDVSISGTGSVSYKGDPQIKKEISGMGSLKKL